MNCLLRNTVVAVILATTPLAFAQTSAAQRSKDLSALFHDIWEDNLKHSPEYASFLGDKRYNDQLSDYSAKEVNVPA